MKPTASSTSSADTQSKRQRLTDQPAYGPAEVARLLKLPAGTLRSWFFGMSYHDGREPFKSVIEPADRANRLLSFNNLCEAHVLASIRRHHRIPLPAVRTALLYVTQTLSLQRPLLDEQFKTDGKDLFVERTGALLNVNKAGQMAMSQVIEAALARIDRDPVGMPIKLYPSSTVFAATVGKPIAIDPAIGFGRPMLISAGVATALIADRFAAGDSITEIATDYRVDQKEIEEAVRFEQKLAA